MNALIKDPFQVYIVLIFTPHLVPTSSTAISIELVGAKLFKWPPFSRPRAIALDPLQNHIISRTTEFRWARRRLSKMQREKQRRQSYKKWWHASAPINVWWTNRAAGPNNLSREFFMNLILGKRASEGIRLPKAVKWQRMTQKTHLTRLIEDALLSSSLALSSWCCSRPNRWFVPEY